MKDMDKHTQLRVESWCKKFCQITNNTEWKKNRNLHAILLLDMIINENYEEPYNRFAPDGPLSQLPKHLVKSRLSKKFWIFSNYILHNSHISNENNSNGNENNDYNNGMNKNNMHFYEMINKCNNPELLKKIIEKLQKKINDMDEMIIQQDEERNFLLNKIGHLEKLIKPYANYNKKY